MKKTLLVFIFLCFLGGIKAQIENFHVKVDNDSICVPTEVVLIAEVEDASGTETYTWTSNPVGLGGTNDTVTYSPPIPGSTWCFCTVKRGFFTAKDSVLIRGFLMPEYSLNGDSSVCQGDTAHYIISIGEEGIYTWGSLNNLGEIEVNTDSTELIYYPYSNSSGEDSIFLAVENGSCMDTIYAPVHVQSNPLLEIKDTFYYCYDEGNNPPTELFVDSINFNSTIEWSLGREGYGTILNPDNPEITFEFFQDSISYHDEILFYCSVEPISPCHTVVIDSTILRIIKKPEVENIFDDTICEIGHFPICPSYSNIDDVETQNWVTLGDGTFDDSSELITTYFPGLSDIEIGMSDLILTSFSKGLACQSNDTITLHIQKKPIIYLQGNGIILCVGGEAIINIIVDNYDTVYPRTNGIGNFIMPNDSILYYQSDSTEVEDIWFYFIAENELCSDTSSYIYLSFQESPFVELMDEFYYCYNEDGFNPPVQLYPDSMNFFQSFLWSTDPLNYGSIINPEEQTITFEFDQDSISYHDTITFFCTLQPINPCTASSEGITKLITIKKPLINFEWDDSICEGRFALVSAEILNNEDVEANSWCWKSMGDGYFGDTTNLITNYFPGDEDMENGFVKVLFTAASLGNSCTSEDSLLIHILKNPTTYFNPFDQVCTIFDTSYLFVDEIDNYQEIKWETYGDGTFDNAQSTNPTYFLFGEDFNKDFINFKVTVFPYNPCDLVIEKDKSLSIHNDPITFSHTNYMNICSMDSAYLAPITISSFDSIWWETMGDGHFSNPNEQNTYYIPGTIDSIHGLVFVRVKALNACGLGQKQISIRINRFENGFDQEVYYLNNNQATIVSTTKQIPEGIPGNKYFYWMPEEIFEDHTMDDSIVKTNAIIHNQRVSLVVQNDLADCYSDTTHVWVVTLAQDISIDSIIPKGAICKSGIKDLVGYVKDGEYKNFRFEWRLIINSDTANFNTEIPKLSFDTDTLAIDAQVKITLKAISYENEFLEDRTNFTSSFMVKNNPVANSIVKKGTVDSTNLPVVLIYPNIDTTEIKDIIWYKDGNPITSADASNLVTMKDRYLYPVEVGEYYVRLESKYGCTALSEIITVTESDLKGFYFNPFDMLMYPNPSSGFVQLKYYINLPEYENGTIQISLSNNLGEEVYHEVFMTNDSSGSIFIQNLKFGFYIVRMKIGEFSITRKLIVE